MVAANYLRDITELSRSPFKQYSPMHPAQSQSMIVVVVAIPNTHPICNVADDTRIEQIQTETCSLPIFCTLVARVEKLGRKAL